MLNKDFIKQSFNNIVSNLGKESKLLAVSKYQSIEKIEYLASLGQVDFGENYSQELESKATMLPNLRWHFIGSIQSRKIKNIVKYVDSIQSVEKIEQLEKISKYAEQLDKHINIYLQVNIDDDPNKSGFKACEYQDVLASILASDSMPNIKIIGLMCIPAKSNIPEKSFIKMKEFFNRINNDLFDHLKLNRLSMGMSADYKLAIKYGSTDVRIGSSLFGERSV